VLHGRVTDYPMNYTRYLDEREKRLELARAAYENQKEEIERIEVELKGLMRKRDQATDPAEKVMAACTARCRGRAWKRPQKSIGWNATVRRWSE
jgi:ATPase subunit of ABC transporter with duplicated ATPase domains